MFDLLEKFGSYCLYHVNQLGRMGVFLFYSLLAILQPPYKIYPIIRQTYLIGTLSIFVIIFTGAFTGMVLGLQGYHTLSKFGAEGLLGSAVALSLIRELGPVLAALIVTGRAGSAICAEIGVMRNSEQVDALECMAIDPFRFLISPKFLATIISVPLLTAMFDVVGIFGGYLAGVKLMGVSSGSYFNGMMQSVTNHDIRLGLIKSFVFALLLIWISTGRGYFVQQIRGVGFGAESVSKVTTQAVVMSSISVLIFDYLLTAVLL